VYLAIEYALIYRYSELAILMINSIQRLESLNFFELDRLRNDLQYFMKSRT